MKHTLVESASSDMRTSWGNEKWWKGRCWVRIVSIRSTISKRISTPGAQI